MSMHERAYPSLGLLRQHAYLFGLISFLGLYMHV